MTFTTQKTRAIQFRILSLGSTAMAEMKPDNEMQEDSLDNGKQPSVPNKSDEDLVPRWAALIGMVAIGLL